MTKKGWISKVRTTAVYEGPPGTMGRDKTPRQMARVLLEVNRDRERGSVLRYMQFVINRAGRNMDEQHREKIRKAMEIVRRTK